jgi:hypothetical protein
MGHHSSIGGKQLLGCQAEVVMGICAGNQREAKWMPVVLQDKSHHLPGKRLKPGGGATSSPQHGRLLIGSPDGDHYELPVDVSWVEPEASFSVLGLSLPSPPNWRFGHR